MKLRAVALLSIAFCGVCWGQVISEEQKEAKRQEIQKVQAPLIVGLIGKYVAVNSTKGTPWDSAVAAQNTVELQAKREQALAHFNKSVEEICNKRIELIAIGASKTELKQNMAETVEAIKSPYRQFTDAKQAHVRARQFSESIQYVRLKYFKDLPIQIRILSDATYTFGTDSGHALGIVRYEPVLKRLHLEYPHWQSYSFMKYFFPGKTLYVSELDSRYLVVGSPPEELYRRVE